MSFVDDFITLLVKAANNRTNAAEMESLRNQFLRMMTTKKDGVRYAPAQVGTDSDKLDGQHGSYYQDAANINAGSLSSDRFSAYGDLTAETKIGPGAAQVAAGDHGHSHTALTDIGTNSHAQIDSHLASTSNPHSVTKAQVGLGNVSNILDKLDATTAPTINDDSGDGYAVGSLWVDVTNDQTYICVDASVGAAVWVGTSSTDAAAIHDNVAGEIAAIAEKVTPVDADVTLIEDSAATNAKKRLSWANIKATLKTHFDTLYAIAAKGVTNGDTHDHSGGDGAQINHTTLSNIGTNTHAQIDAYILDGWNIVAASGTYVDADTFTIPGDHTAYLTLGVKIKLVNSTTLFGYVLNSSYAAPNTTVNLVPNTSFSLADAAITNVSISYGNPPDFPQWLSHTPTIFAAVGTLTTASASAVFQITGDTVLWSPTITITTNGTGSVAIVATLPVNAVGTHIIAGREDEATGTMLQGLIGTGNCTIFTYNNGYPGSDGRILRLTGLYRAE